MGKWPVMTTEKRFRPARMVAPHVVCGFRARTFAPRRPQCIEVQLGWASCPLTQNGCARIMSLPAYPNSQPSPLVIERLREATQHAAHEFWPDEVSVPDDRVVDARQVHGPRQLTDLYLLALAVHRGGTFATLDHRVPSGPVRGATAENLTLI